MSQIKQKEQNQLRSIFEIEKAITQLPREQLKKFRVWYQKFDAKMWDEQIEKDIHSGKLDELAQKAIQGQRSRIIFLI